jgi:SOS-response transcriptional repressor LexA
MAKASLLATVLAVDERLHRRNDPTRLQIKIVDFIRNYRLRTGSGPTLDEVGEAVGLLSKSNVARHVKAMKTKGLVVSSGRDHRSLAVAREHPVSLDLPDDLFAQIWVMARHENISLEKAVISILRTILQANRSHPKPHFPHPALKDRS